MIDQPFRQILPNFAQPLIRLYQRLELSPNQITLCALALACISAFFTAQSWFIPALAIWWLGRLLDGTDGIYARATGQATPFGAFLDIICDMAAYAVMIVGFYVAHPDQTTHWLIILFLYILCITGAVSLGAIEQELKITSLDNRGIRLAAGLAEGGETGIAYTLFLLFPAQIPWLAKLWIGVLLVTILARTVLAKTVLTTQK